MISQKQKELIEQIRLKNIESTKSAHAGHEITLTRWDCFNLVNMCKKCGCTVGDLIKSRANDVRIDQKDVFAHNLARDVKYNFCGRT